jgi:Tol biopolymer transport system component
MLVAFRSRFGRGTLLVDNARVEKLDVRMGYTAWHPAGRMAAYSINNLEQAFHMAGPEVRDVIDRDGALAYYSIDARKSKMVPGASNNDRLESYPAWSPDGRYLYYSSAPLLWTRGQRVSADGPPNRYAEVKYDLRRIRYDIETDQWGKPETVLSAEKTGLSILLPRISPDGKFLLVCMCRYGCFPVYQTTSDLYMMDLARGTLKKAEEVNSEFSESWHSWSSNSRWIAFSSKRGGGTFTRCYLSYVDATGRTHKPLIVPQKDPEFYRSLIKTISVPELLTGPVSSSPTALARAARWGAAIQTGSPSGTDEVEHAKPSQQASADHMEAR